MTEIGKMIRKALKEHMDETEGLTDDQNARIEKRIETLDSMGGLLDDYIVGILGGPILGKHRHMIEHIKTELQLVIAEYLDTAMIIGSVKNNTNGKFMWGEFWRIVTYFQDQLLGCVRLAKGYNENDGR